MKKICLTLIALLFIVLSHAEIKLPKILGDNMVLQRNTNINLWGWGTPNSKVSVKVSWDKNSYTTFANGNGEWTIMVSTPDVRRGESITISDGKKIELTNILIGDVWVCSGQSNMEMPVRGFSDQPVEHSYQTMLSANKEKNIRLFNVAKNSTPDLQADCKGGSWSETSVESVAHFSAVGYFFGQTLSNALDIPIGLINTSWGGSIIEAWMSEKSINDTPDINYEVAKKGNQSNNKVAHLYNGMIYPITNFVAKGFLWYQGESNIDRYYDYDKLMVSMVALWRSEWKNEKMPFYFVQLAPYHYYQPDGIKSGLMIGQQYKALDAIPYSGIAATTDIGNPGCIHPAQKIEIGERLAFLALRNDYNLKGYPNPAPTYRSMSIDKHKITLKFNNLDSFNSFEMFDNQGRKSVVGFEIAGEDKKFYPADAKTNNTKVEIVVSSDSVASPIAVRYGFRNIMERNVVTMWKQPLVPFRTDSW